MVASFEVLKPLKIIIVIIIIIITIIIIIYQCTLPDFVLEIVVTCPVTRWRNCSQMFSVKIVTCNTCKYDFLL